MEEQLELLCGTVSRVIYSNSDTGYTVIEIENDGFSETAVGNMPDVSVGEQLELTGRFAVHASYGQQFKVISYVKTLPSGLAAILKYLSSGTVKGIGPATAKRLVSEFGEETFEVMENEPERVAAVKGLNLKKALAFQKDICGRKSLRELCLRLSKYGLTADETVNAFNLYGNDTAELIERNPYALCRLGIDFDRVDAIAEMLGLPNDNVDRASAGVMYVISHNLQNGHTCLPLQKVTELTCKMLGCDESLCADAVGVLTENRETVVFEGKCGKYIAVTDYYECEKYIAARFIAELRNRGEERAVTDSEIKTAEKQLGITFDELQSDAIRKSVSDGIFILTGGPGTGKTTTVNGIISVMENRGFNIALAAPTGRAAKRMTELTGREAKTIHRLLEVGTSDDGKTHVFVRNERNPLNYDAVIVDEMSMVDVTVFDALLKALRLGTRLVLVGDSDQLPSVGAGNVLKDILASGKFSSVKLEKIFRQAMQSMIVVNAHKIMAGENPELSAKDKDFFMIEQRSPQKAVSLVTDLYCRRLPEAYGFVPEENIQVLCPSRKFDLGTINLNNILQQQINPQRDGVEEIAFKGFVLRKGDKVMQIKNNYDIVWETDDGTVGTGVFNGDVGTLEDIDIKSRMLTVRFCDKVAEYSGDDVMQLELAYAVTVHKSQGSEFDCVILPLLDFPYQLKYRNLLYTAVTRAKKLLIIVGNSAVVNAMTANDRKNLRYTALGTLLSR